MKKVLAIIFAAAMALTASSCGSNQAASSAQISSSSAAVSSNSETQSQQKTEKSTEKTTEATTKLTTEAPTETTVSEITIPPEDLLSEDSMDETTSFAYKNKEYGYTIKFPAEWRKSLSIEEQSNSAFVSFSVLGANKDPAQDAILFSIHIMDAADYDPNSEKMFPKYKYITTSGDKVALCIYPTDVQYDPDYTAGAELYKSFQSQIDSIISTLTFA